MDFLDLSEEPSYIHVMLVSIILQPDQERRTRIELAFKRLYTTSVEVLFQGNKSPIDLGQP